MYQMPRLYTWYCNRRNGNTRKRVLHLCDGFCMPQWNAVIHTLLFVSLGCIPNAGLVTIPKTFHHNLYQINNLKTYDDDDQTTIIQIPNISFPNSATVV